MMQHSNQTCGHTIWEKVVLYLQPSYFLIRVTFSTLCFYLAIQNYKSVNHPYAIFGKKSYAVRFVQIGIDESLACQDSSRFFIFFILIYFNIF